MAIDRRSVMGLSAGGAAGAMLPAPARAAPMPLGSLGIDVTHFGVAPGSADDQSEALQRAIDASAEARVPLWLPAGSYVAADLVLPSGAQIYGIRGATRLVLGHGASIVASARADQVTLQGLVFDGRGEFLPRGRGLIFLREVRGCRILDCLVQESAGAGIVLAGVEGEVAHTTVIGASLAAIHAVDSRGLLLANNTVVNCAETGILVERAAAGGDGTQILANRIENIGAGEAESDGRGDGIRVRGGAHVVVADNRLHRCSASAVRADGTANLQVRGNAASASGGVAIRAEAGLDGAVIAGNAIDGAASGIAVGGAGEGGRLAVIQGNLVRNLGRGRADAGHGIGIAADADSAIAGNVIEGAPLAGIVAGWSRTLRDVAVTGNIVRTAPIGIGVSVAPGAGPALVAHNLIAGASAGAVVGLEGGRAVTGDLAREETSRFAQITVSGNRVR